MKKNSVLIVFPTGWDQRQLDACRDQWKSRFNIVLGSPSDNDCPWDFDIIGYVGQLVDQHRGQVQGIFSSSDYPGATVAGAVATALGLPGSRPETIIQCSHKYYSRLTQKEAVPEATPEFHLVPARGYEDVIENLSFPCFIKPVKGAFSVMSQKLNNVNELREFLSRPAVAEFSRDYIAIFNRLVEELTELEIGGDYFLTEAFLNGSQVTVEGYVYNGDVHVLGVVDSVMYPGTGSFARFDYPSALPPEIQDATGEITRRVITSLGLTNSLFNIEMIYEPYRDSIHIVEVNPRMCGQFADLYQKVDGTSSYQVALDLAVGEKPAPLSRAGKYQSASSFALRTFDRVIARKVPDRERLAEVEQRYPDTLIWWECEAGQDLSDFETIEDGQSYRYAVINIGGDSRAELQDKLADINRDLAYEFQAVTD